MSEPIIQIEHLNKTFGAGPTAVHALEDINLAVQPGEMAKGSRCGGAQAELPHRQGDGQEVYRQAHPQGQGGERLQ